MGTPTRFKKNLVGETQNLLKQLINNRTQVITVFRLHTIIEFTQNNVPSLQRRRNVYK